MGSGSEQRKSRLRILRGAKRRRAGAEPIAGTQRQIDELIAKAELTDAYAAEAAHALAVQSGRQYSNLRAMMFMYTTGLRRRFDLSADEELDAAMSGIWFVSTEEEVRQCLQELNEAFLRVWLRPSSPF